MKYIITERQYRLLSENIEFEIDDDTISVDIVETELTEKCWRGYTQKGMKTMFGKRYPNCVKNTK